MYSIIGRHALANIAEVITIAKEKYKLKSLEGPMTPGVAQAVQKRLEGFADVTIGEEEEVDKGLSLPWVTVRLNER